jgi:hypothetical protein
MAALTRMPVDRASSAAVAVFRPSARVIEAPTPGVTGRLPCSIFRSKLTEIAAASAN